MATKLDPMSKEDAEHALINLCDQICFDYLGEAASNVDIKTLRNEATMMRMCANNIDHLLNRIEGRQSHE